MFVVRPASGGRPRRSQKRQNSAMTPSPGPAGAQNSAAARGDCAPCGIASDGNRSKPAVKPDPDCRPRTQRPRLTQARPRGRPRRRTRPRAQEPAGRSGGGAGRQGVALAAGRPGDAATSKLGTSERPNGRRQLEAAARGPRGARPCGAARAGRAHPRGPCDRAGGGAARPAERRAAAQGGEAATDQQLINLAANARHGSLPRGRPCSGTAPKASHLAGCPERPAHRASIAAVRGDRRRGAISGKVETRRASRA